MSNRISPTERKQLERIAKDHNGHYANGTTIGVHHGDEWTAQFNKPRLGSPDQTPRLSFFINGRSCQGETLEEALQNYRATANTQISPSDC